MKNLISHLVGDYLLQSNWMAVNKGSDNKAAVAHAFVYTLAFLPHKPSLGMAQRMYEHCVAQSLKAYYDNAPSATGLSIEDYDYAD